MLTGDTTHDAVLANLLGQPSTSAQGQLDPRARTDSENDHDGSTPDIKEKEDELWSHLSKILDLQSEITHLHVEMEGVGAKNNEGRRNVGRKASQEWDRVGIEQDEEEEANKAREEEFAALANKFTGRKAAIDGIMGKLDELSHALTTFHALKTPSLNVVGKRRQSSSSTNDTTTPTTTVSPFNSQADPARHMSEPSTVSSVPGTAVRPKLPSLAPLIRPATVVRNSQPLQESPVSIQPPKLE